MNTFLLKSAPLLLAGSLLLVGASTAHAQFTINYSLGTFAFTTPNQYAGFNLTSRTNTLTLLPGVAQTVNIQGIVFNVNDTNNFSTQNYTGNVSRTLTVNGATQNAVQGYNLSTQSGNGTDTFANDFLSFNAGTASQVLTFNLGLQGVLTFTPEPLDPGSFQGYDTGKYISNDQGKFLLTPAAVPEASTTVSFGLLLAGLGLVGVRLRKRSAARV